MPCPSRSQDAKPIQQWFGGNGWGECEVEQFERAARAYHRVFPDRAVEALRMHLAATRGELEEGTGTLEEGWSTYSQDTARPILLPLRDQIPGLELRGRPAGDEP